MPSYHASHTTSLAFSLDSGLRRNDAIIGYKLVCYLGSVRQSEPTDKKITDNPNIMTVFQNVSDIYHSKPPTCFSEDPLIFAFICGLIFLSKNYICK